MKLRNVCGATINYSFDFKVALLLLLTLLSPPSKAHAAPCDPTAIQGTIYRDYNANGIYDTAEPGVAGIGVRIVGTDGIERATTTSEADGTYATSAPTGQALRVEFFSLPFYLNPGVLGAN